MLKKFRVIYLVLVIIFISSLLVVIARPNKFQKFNSIKNIELLSVSRDLSNENTLNVEKFVGNIPYKNVTDYVYSVLPARKYERTILEGYGDCSTMSFGAADFLLKNRIQFELIHFLPPDSLFAGGGHVALRVPYSYEGQSRVGILDLAGGGLPFSDGKFLDYADFYEKKFPVKLHKLNHDAPGYYENYYSSDYLSKVFFAVTPGSEVNEYFEFITRIYISFGNEKLEKIAYDGLAIFFNKYYSIYVSSDFLNKFTSEIIFYKTILFIFRVFSLILVGTIFLEILFFWKRRAKK